MRAQLQEILECRRILWDGGPGRSRWWRESRGALERRCGVGMAAFGAAHRASALELFAGQFGGPTSNLWNVYEAIDTQFTFAEAMAFAATRPDPTGGDAVGHLVAIRSLAENNFVATTPGIADRWIGLTDRVGVAAGATESQLTLDQLTLGWKWVTGEAFDPAWPRHLGRGRTERCRQLGSDTQRRGRGSSAERCGDELE